MSITADFSDGELSLKINPLSSELSKEKIRNIEQWFYATGTKVYLKEGEDVIGWAWRLGYQSPELFWAGYCIVPSIIPVNRNKEAFNELESFKFCHDITQVSVEDGKQVIGWDHNHPYNKTDDYYQTIEDVIKQIQKCHALLELNKEKIRDEMKNT